MSVFSRGKRPSPTPNQPPQVQSAVPSRPGGKVTSVLGRGIQITGTLRGQGGVRIEGSFEGKISLEGLLVVAESGRVVCENLHAKAVVVMGIVQGNITADRVEIRRTGRVWGNVTTASFATEEGAFLRGQIKMEENLPTPTQAQTAENTAEASNPPTSTNSQ